MSNVRAVKKPATPEELELYSYVQDNALRVANEIAQGVLASPVDKGGIVLVYGVQNSGKTIVACKLLDLLAEHGRKVIASQPGVNRPDVPKGKYYSRSGVEKRVVSFDSKTDIVKMFNQADVVIVDEIQFVPYELQVAFLKEVTSFVERGGWLLAIGVVMTAQGGEFLLPAILKERSVKTYELTATCQKCGRKGARLNQRLINGIPTVSEDPELIAPSDKVVYEPRCSDCVVVVG